MADEIVMVLDLPLSVTESQQASLSTAEVEATESPGAAHAAASAPEVEAATASSEVG